MLSKKRTTPSKTEMRSLRSNIASFGIAPNIFRKQVRSLVPLLAKVVIDVINLI
jgi:hypothetical protein